MWVNQVKIILGSGSPRRKELLEGLGFSIQQDVRPVDEVLPKDYALDNAATYLAELKSTAFNTDRLASHEVLLTADTIVLVDDQILGKPQNRQEAVKMIEQLSERSHQVVTGVCLKTRNKTCSFSVSTHVWFKKLELEEINYYIDTFQPFDKAGAYGIQEWIGKIGIVKIEGCFYNVMGLPTTEVFSVIKAIMNFK